MELRHLRYFIAVAEELHFGRAAERLVMAQPPLSQQIQRLERELGVELFYRTRRRVELSEAGELFLEQARRTLGQAELAIATARRAQRGELGRLAIGFVGSATYTVLRDVLRRFTSHNPDVAIHLNEMTTTEQIQAIKLRRLDLGFVRPAPSEPDVETKQMIEEPFVLALEERHPLAGSKTVNLSSLADEPFILYPRQLGPALYDPVVSACGRAGFSPNVVQEAAQMHTIISLVAIGMGVALVPASVRQLKWRGVVFKSLGRSAPRTTIALAWNTNNRSPALLSLLTQIDA